MLCTTSYKDDFAKIALPDIQRMSRNKKKYVLSSVKMESMATGTTYKKDFGTWKVIQDIISGVSLNINLILWKECI